MDMISLDLEKEFEAYPVNTGWEKLKFTYWIVKVLLMIAFQLERIADQLEYNT